MRKIGFLLFLVMLLTAVTAFATPEMSPDGRSCYAPGCHQWGEVDKDLKEILEALGDTIDDPDPSKIIVKYNEKEMEKIPVEVQYTPGEYTVEEKGMEPLSVTLTFDETTITQILLQGERETPSIGGVAAKNTAKAIMLAQSAEVDTVSGATKTSGALIRAAKKCILLARGEEIPVEEPAK